MTQFVLRYQATDFALAAGRVWTFGRDPTCDVRVDDPAASREHARLEVTPRDVFLEDLGSRNGVNVNGERLVGRVKIEPGDWFRIGRTEFSVQRAGTDAVVSGIAPAYPADAADTTERILLRHGNPASGPDAELVNDFDAANLTTTDAPVNPVALISENGRRWLYDEIAPLADRMSSTLEMIDLLARSGAQPEAGKLLGEALDVLGSRAHEPIPPVTTARARERVAQLFPSGPADSIWRARIAGLDRVERANRGRDGGPSLTAARTELDADLRRAVGGGEVRNHYQPIVDLKTGRIVGHEALSRWKHPQRGFVPPAQFIPLAEQNGLIGALGRRVLNEACSALGRWRTTYPSLGMSVNVSSHQFQLPDLVEQIEHALSEASLAPEALTLELTESAIMQDARAAAHTLVRLRALGVRVSIDDFGTGYSSLSYLHQFPLSSLKIDRSFVANLGRKRENAEIVRTIVTLAHGLNLAAVAEGIETEDQLARLRGLRCDYGQGYLFSRPTSEEQAEILLVGDPKW